MGNRIRGKVDLKAARKVEVGGGIPSHETFEMRFLFVFTILSCIDSPTHTFSGNILSQRIWQA